MKHSHTFGWSEPEIYSFADSIVKKESGLPKIINQEKKGSKAWLKFSGDIPILTAWLNYTINDGQWDQRQWLIVPASLNAEKGIASALIPDGVTAYFFNITDIYGLTVSSEMVMLQDF